ncbi:SH3 domain-containing protein [Mesorhizobium sp. CGMCC 1.15528]|uniref:SH3 domain-containing protein n=1 Tax=Mesorhizobium zhangyense TaxID=1776730 RepID=A0A7C9VCF1_9HYPH|nr:SH3 domain-containing protein [Mesorhizobium zhangyense]NGN45283.1 SH3 domain-containing protein [Mesorhizobium zhangyense]
MKASRLAEINGPQDAGTLEDELWRSLPASSPSPRQETVPASPLWQRPFPAPANDRTRPSADVPHNAPAQPAPANQDSAAPGASPYTQTEPAAEMPAYDPVEEASHRHYDWDCKIADDPVDDTPTRFEKLDRVYQALAARLGWLGSVSPRALALPAAGVVVVGGLIAGMTLLYDPLAHSTAEPAAAETLKTEIAAQPVPPAVVPQNETAQQAAMAAPPAPAATAQQPQASVNALETDSERWARTDAEQASPSPDQNQPATAAKDAGPSQPEATAFADEEKTAAIPANKPAAVQAAAATETPPADTAKPQPAAAIGKGRITTAVNMRAGPADESKVLRTIPARATVDIITCKGWCKIAYEGQQGWIYKKFLNRG